jgi:hypothetical protein
MALVSWRSEWFGPDGRPRECGGLSEQDRGTVSSHMRLEDAQDQARPEEQLCLNSVAG